jgi:urease accessory protein
MRTETTRATSATFAANRAQGRVKFDVHLQDGVTRRGVLHESGSLRVRFPSPEAEGLSGVFVNTAGGIAGGDRFDIDVATGEGSRLTLTTAAAEKVYRAGGPAAQLNIALKAEARSHLAWLPQETILFNQARLTRTVDIDLAEDARLLLAEAIVFGRSGMGEAVDDAGVFDRWRLHREGRLIHVEAMRLDGAVAAKLAQPAIAKGGVAVATVLIVPADEAVADSIRSLDDRFRGEVGVSAWDGLAIVRLCAADGATLRHDLVAVLTAMRGGSLPRLWVN